MKTIEYWHPKRGIGRAALDDSEFVYSPIRGEGFMSPLNGTVVSYDPNNYFWKVESESPSRLSPFYLRQQDFDYDNPDVGDKVEVYYAERGNSRINRARRTA